MIRSSTFLFTLLIHIFIITMCQVDVNSLNTTIHALSTSRMSDNKEKIRIWIKEQGMVLSTIYFTIFSILKPFPVLVSIIFLQPSDFVLHTLMRSKESHTLHWMCFKNSAMLQKILQQMYVNIVFLSSFYGVLDQQCYPCNGQHFS